MRLFNIIIVATLGLLLAACETVKVKPEPVQMKSSDMSKSSLVGLVSDLDKVTKGRYAVVLKATDWDIRESEGREICAYTKVELSLNNTYQETTRSGFSQSFESVTFVDSPLSEKEIKAGGFDAQFIIEAPRIAMMHDRDRRSFFDEPFFWASYIKGTVTAQSKAGRIDQMDIEAREKVEADPSEGCQSGSRIGSESTSAAIHSFTIEMISASKALLNNLNQ